MLSRNATDIQGVHFKCLGFEISKTTIRLSDDKKSCYKSMLWTKIEIKQLVTRFQSDLIK